MRTPPEAASHALEHVVAAQLELSASLRHMAKLAASIPHLSIAMQDVLRLDRKVLDGLDGLTEAFHEEPARAFWRGAALGFLESGRRDLLSSFPEAEDAALLMEAEDLLRESP